MVQPTYRHLTREEAANSGMNDFARTLARQRRDKSVSVGIIAKMVQVSSEEYRRWEKGTGFPKLRHRYRLATLLWNNNRARVEQLCKRGRRQRRTALTALVLRKNKITLADLRHFRRMNKTWLSIIKDALVTNAEQLTANAVTTLQQELSSKNHLSAAAMQNIATALQLNFADLHRMMRIEAILIHYQHLHKQHGDFLLDNPPMRRALDSAQQVLDRKDKRSLPALLAKLPRQSLSTSLPLTFGARLRHADIRVAEAAAASGIDAFTLELYYYGLLLPVNKVNIIKKICKAFALTFTPNLCIALGIEEKARKYLQKMFHIKVLRVDGITRRALHEAIETIMADYSQLSRKLFRRRIALQLSMRKAAQQLQLDFDDYLELEWCMYPAELALLQVPRFCKKLATFLNTTTATLQHLTSETTATREERHRHTKNAKLAREAQLAAEAASAQDIKLAGETPKIAAQRILCQLTEQKITAATLHAYNETFVARLRMTGVCTPAAASKGGIDAAKLRFYYHGRGFPNDSDLRKICLGFGIKDSVALRHLIEIERVIMEYQLAIACLGKLPLPQPIAHALQKAAAVKMRDYSEFSRVLFKRRTELRLSQVEAARHLGCKDASDYRKLEWSVTPSLSRALRKTEFIDAVADFLQLPPAAVQNLVGHAAEQHRGGREDTPAAAAWNINQRIRTHALSVTDFNAFTKTFATHLRAAKISVVEASARCQLDSTRLRQYVDGKGFPIDNASLTKVCQAFMLDVATMTKLVNIEKTLRRYMADTSRLGKLPLPATLRTALEKAVETIIAEYSEFSLRLYRRRSELQITQREAAEKLGIDNSNSYRKMEQSTKPLLDRNFKKNPQILANIAKFLQMPIAELEELFVTKHTRNTQSNSYARQIASERLLKNLQQQDLSVELLNNFNQSFAARLRASGVSLAEACRRSVFPRSKIKPCFDGQHMPVGKYELRQFCSDFSLGDYEMVRQQLNIEKMVRDYMAKTTRHGALDLPAAVKAALEQAVQVIMADYCELSRRLTQRRTELQLSMESAAAELGIRTHEYYRKLERSIGTLPTGALRGNPETITRMAEFLQISVAQLQELIAQASANEESETPPPEDETPSELKLAVTEIVHQLGEKCITPACLRAFDKTFATHLRATGIDAPTAAARVDMDATQLEPYLRGERTPNTAHELQKICAAFGLNNHTELQRVADIEAVVGLYMLKISELGPLPFPEETKDALNRVVQIIKSTYSEFGKLLFRKRFDLKMSLEDAAQELGIEQTQNYHELERSAAPSSSAVLRTNPAIVANLAEFLELPLAQVQQLVGTSSLQ